jgi:hypothetical protein
MQPTLDGRTGPNPLESPTPAGSSGPAKPTTRDLPAPYRLRPKILPVRVRQNGVVHAEHLREAGVEIEFWNRVGDWDVAAEDLRW